MKKNKTEEKEKSKVLIMQAAIEVFTKEGFYAAKIAKIAEVSGMSVGKIYLSFESKEDILEEIFLRAWQEIEDKFVQFRNQQISCEEKLIAAFMFIVEAVEQNRNLARLILQERRFWKSAKNDKISVLAQSVNDRLANIVREGINNGEFYSDMYPELIASYMIGALWTVLEFWSGNMDTIDKDTIAKQVISAAAKGIKKIQ